MKNVSQIITDAELQNIYNVKPSERIVYRGGQHVIACDGKQHYCCDIHGRRYKDGLCYCS